MKSDAKYREELLRLGVRSDAVKTAIGKDLDNIGNLVGILRDDPPRAISKLPASPPEFFSTEFVFPRSAKVGEVEMSTGGLTLRDYFASQTIVGLAVRGANNDMIVHKIARAYAIADAMLEARKR